MHLGEEPPTWEHQLPAGSPLPLSSSPHHEPSRKKTGAGEEMRWRNWTVAQRGGEARPRRGRGREWVAARRGAARERGRWTRGVVGGLVCKATADGFLQNGRGIRISSSRWTDILESGEFSATILNAFASRRDFAFSESFTHRWWVSGRRIRPIGRPLGGDLARVPGRGRAQGI